MRSPRIRPSRIVSDKARRIYEEMAIRTESDNDEATSFEQYSPPRPSNPPTFLHTSSIRYNNNVRRQRRAQTSLFDYLPQSFQDRYGNDDQQNEDWGASYRDKPSNTIRLGYTNPNGLGINPTSAKSHSTFSFLCHRSQADIISLAETNLNWSQLDYNSRLNNRIRSFYRDFYAVTSHNRHEQHSKA